MKFLNEHRASTTPRRRTRAQALASDYLGEEAEHRDPDASAEDEPGQPLARIELF